MGLPRWSCLIGFLLMAPHAALAADPPDTLKDVEVDLPGALFKQVLPFDETFLIHGQVPATTKRVSVQFIGRPFNIRVVPGQPRDCLATPKAETTTPPPKCYRDDDKSEPCVWEPEKSGPILWERQEPPPDEKAPLTFRVPIPPLEAKHHYVFNFEVQRALTTDDLRMFHDRATAALDPALRANRNDDPTAADNQALREKLVHELQMVACPGLRIVSDNLFNLSVEYQKLPDNLKIEFNNLVGNVLNAQGQILDNVKGRSGNQIDFSSELKSIAENQALAKLIQAFREKAAGGRRGTDTLLKEFLDRNQNALRFAGLSGNERSLIAQGLPADGTARPEFVETMAADAAGQYAASYRATERDLLALEDWLRRLIDRSNRPLLDEVVASGALTQADVTSLGAVADHVGEAADLAGNLANNAEQVRMNQEARTKNLASLVNVAEVQAQAAGVLLQSNTLGSFKTQQSWYIAADFGFLYGWEIDKSVPYLGTNIYFRPVNKAVPLSEKGGWGRRFALTLGLTVKSIADADPQTRNDLFNNNSLLIGAGWRMTDSGRLGVGALIFEERDPNPLLSNESVTYSPYVSLSFDFDILSFFKGFTGLFPNS